MDDTTLLKALIGESLISEELADSIKKEAASSKKTAEETIYARRVVDEETVAAVKSKILGIPHKKIKAEDIPEDVLKLIPEETVATYAVAPLEMKDKTLIVGMVRPWDTRSQEALRFIAKQNQVNLGVYLVTPSNIDLILRRYSPYETEVEKAVKSLNIDKLGDTLSPLARAISIEEKKTDMSEEAPVIKIVSSTLKAAVERGASDVHIEPQRTRLRIRFRIDGLLQEVSSFPIELHQPIVSRVKILSNLKIDENRIPQDGRFRTIIFNRDIDFRVATLPTPVGEKVAVRVLDPTVGLRSIEELGLTGATAALVKREIEKPFGMILITGPTGSGKTTTLYSLLRILNNEDTNVVSLEDPVEYFIEGVNQSQVKTEIGYSFASGLRQILRQDPDVIMVGEIRDNETAELAVHAALTGHIVLSTLHTNNAVGVIPRLIDMGVEPFLIPTALNMMMAQRLVRRLCDECKETLAAPAEMQKIIKEELAKMPDAARKELQVKEPYQIYRQGEKKDCKTCKGRGVIGRIALFEGFVMTGELENIINTGATESKIHDEAARQEMITMRQDGVVKALGGIVAMEEVLRETV